MSITRREIRDEIIRRTSLGAKYTLSAGAAGYITDDEELKGPHASSLVARGSPVRTRDLTTPTAVGEYEDSWADIYDPTTGKVTVQPDFDVEAPEATDVAEIWLPEIGRVSNIDDDINLTLTEDCGYWTPFVLTLVTDGDMETATADIDSYWSKSGSATLAKVGGAFPHRLARQALRVSEATLGTFAFPYDGSATVSINVVPGDTYRVDVLARAASADTSVLLVIYDQTNGAAITLEDSATDTTEKQWVRLYSTFTIPSGCYQITPQLGGNVASADTYWAALSIVRVGDRRISLPARVTHMNNIGRVYQRMGSEVDNFYRGLALEYDVDQVQDGYDLILPPGVLGSPYPVYAEEWQNYTALADELTATVTDCELEYVVPLVIRRIYLRLWETEEQKRTTAEWVNKWTGPLARWDAAAKAIQAARGRIWTPRIRFPQLQTAAARV